MIEKLKVPGSNPKNMFQIKESDGFCCGDTMVKVFGKYKAEINTANLQTAKLISIGGAEYKFGMSYDLTSEEGIQMVVEAIKKALWKAGYSDDGIEYSVAGNTLTFTTHWSEISFDYLETAANSFSKFEHTVRGRMGEKGSCILSLLGSEDANIFKVNALTTSPITNVKVMEGTATTRVDAAPDAEGNVQFASAGFAGSKTFTVIVETQGCGELQGELTYQF